jgi:GntR family transcriptional regulator
MPVLSRTAPLPLYHQLKTVLLGEIEAGRWQPDDQLPTEHALADRFHVSKITVRQALRELVDQGYIRREQGRGTFIERRRLQQGPRDLTSFTEEMRSHGLVSTSKVLDQRAEAAPAAVAAALALEPWEPVFRLRRLRLADGKPMGVQTAYLPLDLVPGIAKDRFKASSLYDLLATRYGLHAATARETFCVGSTTRVDAVLLKVPVRSPAMVAERVAFLADGRPMEYVRSLMRGDRYKIVLDLRAHAMRST